LVGDRSEPCGTLACIPFGVNISPSTDLRFFFLKELKSFIKFTETCNFGNFITSQGVMLYERFLHIQDYRSHIVVEI
jgi:hypothetical protein